MLYIRADGNPDIGMGHVMRCLSVAEAAADAGMRNVVFITADGGCRSMIEDRGFRVIVLGTDYRDMECEIPQLGKRFHKGRDVLLVDSYQAGATYYLALGKHVKMACFEDMGQAYPVDLLINYNMYAPGLEQNYRVPGRPGKALLGARYAPLGKAFQAPCDYTVRDKVTNVMITTGGSDPYFAAGAFAEAFLKDSFLAAAGIRLDLVSGPFNKSAAELRHRYGGREDVAIHENVKDMRQLFLQSDVVVTAAGSTVYEVSSLGVPMIVFYFAENQRQGADAMGRFTDVANAGCFADEGGAVAERAVNALCRCMEDREYRRLLHGQEKKLVDGKGALRIAGELAKMMV